jgi:hypothetical protein
MSLHRVNTSRLGALNEIGSGLTYRDALSQGIAGERLVGVLVR